MSVKWMIEKEAFMPENLDYKRWPLVLVDGLSAEDQDRFNRRRLAVEMYLDGRVSNEYIITQTGISKDELYRFVRRCLDYDNSGKIWGYRALIPKKHLKPYIRKKIPQTDQAGLAGAFEHLLVTYPSIRETIEKLYLNRKDRSLLERFIRPKDIWKQFINACRKAGIKPTEYPLNTKNLGKRSLERYLKKIENIYFDEAVKRYGEEAARHARVTGQGVPNSPNTHRPFQTVEFDGHKIDAVFAIEFQTPDGDTVVKIMDRIWLLVIVDKASRSVLGYHVALNKEYSADDVRACIRSAILPWSGMPFTIDGLKYSETGGFPSGAIPETSWAVWDEFKYDNGKANLAKSVVEQLTKSIGCSINAGPVAVPERRGIIERLFLTLEENGYHRLPNTTGSKPSDPRRHNAEGKAIRYRISYAHLVELTEVLIANYNGTPHDGLCYLTPLEVLQQRLDPNLLRKVPENKRQEAQFLTLQVSRKVAGNIKTGRRPYILYEGATYRNEVLSRSAELIGSFLTLVVNVEDLRVIRAFLPDGSELGLLQANGKWGLVPHSLKTRKEINRLRDRKLIYFCNEDDPIEVYREYLVKKAKSTKSSCNKLERVRIEAKQIHSTVLSDANLEPIMTSQSFKPKTLATNNSSQLECPRRTKTIIY
ncbi:hypothetical protein [Desulfotomaculum sp. 1211_IL3151]|uniref:hypothetical protein n=1 Tax=Desulfotomaculum sp. 1211_IL3151 TaxID=3084055 RepID=UPI002FDB5BA0